MGSYYPESKVEIKGWMAKYYDILLDLATLGRYFPFMEKIIRLMKIRPTDRIIDLGTGTGRNARLMLKYLSIKGELIGLDISEEMILKFKKKCANFPNAKILYQRIDQSLSYSEGFDKVFISFVLHGFPQTVRILIIENSFNALKSNGELFILDYNEFSLKDMPFYLRILFKFIECPYAFDFITRDWKKILKERRFNHFEEHNFFGEYVRLLKAIKNTPIGC